ncbi:DNA repair protein RadA [Beggiatoa leptomitoformis]|uniref:DNA repair protein RadA n=1 Tax=Beggiatoa leptomitoformis TaxID=288004 RepID=A0A650GDY2_9GAMM|nr:DNA repair protein RadA [Beggiatoa leptomitoformis]ALG66531.1 DNA repair protein RadA [Beggiatoa leptomitoformis]QGX04019.1 DNA repair protein RadA [Beggiatoa leptomitoformis]
MSKIKTAYTCKACGAIASKWLGQCPDCHAWNSLEETVLEETAKNRRLSGYAGTQPQAILMLDAIEVQEETRMLSGLAELDRVLGGGLVSGSVVLIGGDPGIGKSTLLLQTLAEMSQIHQPDTAQSKKHKAHDGNMPLYVTGEESPQQVSLRAQRLGLNVNRIKLLTETHIERILQIAKTEQPKIMVIDSIQTVYTDVLQSAPGSVAQVRESAAQLVRFAKQSNTAIFLVGHVTKEGALAGPRVLEHMVDTVLYFEGESDSRFRVIRAIKNRFGAVNELGIFSMTDRGLKEVSNPSAIFLSRHEEEVAGSVIMVTREGSRPMLVEVQALVDTSHMPNPRRVTLGLDQNRLAMLLAVLSRHGGVVTYDQDVFVNVVGGVRVSETGADLAVLLAILSSLKNVPLSKELVVFGEVGLAGEIRPVPNGLERLREAAKHGFKRAIVPKANAPKEILPDIEVIPVIRLVDALYSV